MPEPRPASVALAQLAEEYWDVSMRSRPTEATLLGDHRFDDLVEDFSEDGDQALRDALDSIRARVRGLDVGELDATERVTARLLESDADDTIRSIDLRIVELRSDQMDGPHLGYLM